MKDVNWKEHLLSSLLKDARVGAAASHVGEVFQTVLRKRKLNLKEKEVKMWKKKAAQIFISMQKNRLIEQFEGYFKLKRISIKRRDEFGIPLIPRTFGSKDFGKTQLIKQPDEICKWKYLHISVF